MTIRREPVSYEDGTFKAINQFTFWSQCIADLAEGKHAVGCGCLQIEPVTYVDFKDGLQVGAGKKDFPTGCLRIARCARDLAGYELEEGP